MRPIFANTPGDELPTVARKIRVCLKNRMPLETWWGFIEIRQILIVTLTNFNLKIQRRNQFNLDTTFADS